MEWIGRSRKESRLRWSDAKAHGSGSCGSRPGLSNVSISFFDSRLALTVRALLMFVALDVGFRLFGFPRVYGLVRQWAGRFEIANESAATPSAVDRTLLAVASATRYYWRRRLDCLPRSLTTYLLLRQQGVFATLRIGVRRYPFGAHAWVECQGRVLEDLVNPWRHEPYVPIM